MGDFSKLNAFLGQNPNFAVTFNSKLKETALLISQANEKLQVSDLSTFLAFLNEQQSIAHNHSFYSMLLSMGHGSNYAGPEVVADWYKRNMIIFNNLTRIVDPATDQRVLVVFGQGHAKLLKEFISEYSDYELVDVNDYLLK